MILKSLEADNFQKYEKIQIMDLPERGIVGVVGANESGKTTLGEAIAFALFGRTLRLDENQLEEIINWEKESCRVSVAFTMPDGVGYRVTREIDRDGTCGAWLEDTRSGDEVASGVGKVNRKLSDLLGAPFDEFRYSFYLGQKELGAIQDSSPEARRSLLDHFIGVSSIDEAAAQAEAEMEELSEEKQRLKEESSIQREVARQITIDPEDYERQQAELEETRVEKERFTSELSELEQELKTRSGAARSISLSRALGLRAALRGYGVAFGRLASRLRQASRQLDTKLQSVERDAAATSGKLEEFRVFEAKRGELASVVQARQLELESQLRNTLDADYSAEEAEFITPNSKAEQLSFTRKKLEETIEFQESLDSCASRRINVGAILWLSGFVFLYWKSQFVFMPFVAFGILYMLWGVVTRARAAEIEEGRGRLSMNMDRLTEDVGRLENARQACLRFDAGSAKSMADNSGQTGSDLIKKLHDQLASRFAEFLEDDVSVEDLIGRENGLRDEAAGLRTEQSSIDLLVSDLEEEIQKLAGGGHARVVRPAADSEESFEPGETREWRPRIRTMIDRCRKAQFHLEKAPVDVLDRDFSEFEKSLADLPEPVRQTLDVTFLAELDSLTTDRDDSELERLLEQQLAGLESLLDIAEEAERATEERERKQHQTRISLEDSERRMASLERELARLEPTMSRVRDLESKQKTIANRLEEIDRHLSVHRKLEEMFVQVREQMRGRFGPSIAEFIAWVLPQLTGERYREVKVTPELNVEVFSPEKGDFVNLVNLSGGTVDQVFLTLRLAFSKALIQTKHSADYKQYLFFDEPLSSFDERRSGSFLELLKKFHHNFDQVFVVTHTQGVEEHFDRLIETSIETRELVSN